MAIAFGAAGLPISGTVPASGVVGAGVPAGVVAGNLLLAVLLFDCNTNSTPPAGWTLVQRRRAATAAGSFQPPTVEVWRRVATGTEGSFQIWTFSTAAWPAGTPDVLAQIFSYTGTDTSTPIEVSATVAGTSEVPSISRQQAQLTTSAANSWLMTVWGLSGSLVSTTISPSDTSRSTATPFHALTLGVWDNAAALAAGLQAQRTTSTNSIGSWDGDVGVSLSIKIAPGAGAGVAQAQTAFGSGTAFGAAAAPVNGPWDQCGPEGLPDYTWAVDWPQTGLAAAGRILNANPYFPGGTTGWTGVGASVGWSDSLYMSSRRVPVAVVTPDGVTTSGGMTQAPRTASGSVTAGMPYVADCWAWTPAAWGDVRTCVDWYTAADTFISTSFGSLSTIAAGTWTHLVQTLTAPATAARAAVRFKFGLTPPTSQVFYVYGLLLMDPSLPEDRITPSPLDQVGQDILSSGAAWAYGRDQMRQISPAALGTASFTVDNTRRVYSPDVTSSPLNGNLDAARPMAGQVQFGGNTYPLFAGRIDDYTVHADRNNRTVDFTFLDSAAAIQTTPVTTTLYSGIRTGDAVNIILDAVGWTGPRDIDPGATVMPWWWLDATAAGDALSDLMKSEGPPSIAYAGPDGTFVFRDRTHRLLRDQSLEEQGVFTAAAIDCAVPAATGLSYTDPVTYTHGWRDIINSVTFQVGQRAIAALPSAVWSTTSTISVTTGQPVTLQAVASDPFLGAITPVAGTDYAVTGAGTLTVSISRTSGLSTTVTLTATSADVIVTGMQLRAYSVPVANTVTVSRSDPTSTAEHGTKAYPDTVPWAGAGDADAIAQTVLAKYAERRPLIQIRVVCSDPVHFVQIVSRTVSDLIRVVNGELGLNAEFYVEHVAHQADRMDWGKPPVHAVVLGCEMVGSFGSANPFTFDLRGAGFDQGVWDPPSQDDPATVFVFNDPLRGVFNVGRLGT